MHFLSCMLLNTLHQSFKQMQLSKNDVNSRSKWTGRKQLKFLVFDWWPVKNIVLTRVKSHLWVKSYPPNFGKIPEIHLDPIKVPPWNFNISGQNEAQFCVQIGPILFSIGQNNFQIGLKLFWIMFLPMRMWPVSAGTLFLPMRMWPASLLEFCS